MRQLPRRVRRQWMAERSRSLSDSARGIRSTIWRVSWRRVLGKRRQEPSPETGDLLMLAELEKTGADLSQPRELVHYLYVPTRDAAETAADELRAQGYAVDVRA